jgi:hypothetical protein
MVDMSEVRHHGSSRAMPCLADDDLPATQSVPRNRRHILPLPPSRFARLQTNHRVSTSARDLPAQW